MFYEDERQLSVEDSLNIPMERPKIFTVDHLQFHHVEPPNDLNPNCLLGLKVKGADEEK